ncbi:folylpolyglutamate synthase/dihydrofolate synthase family protein [Carnobacterium sp. ISL-102]|uniref:bifunctional folylpolyglutamate synthase/dihydrofolate synthase n=1 Tax=Carnobacterium sp. ISL-102 TaxID=2819142 RepID=UPI001BEB8378|nr:folylpolyglutamate synthase/dihydrofolate synthase family protein [Carnobacterium sp. ISL-102]MBT2731712.1 bifunctional folylpolyglutamate synthase/dihydrofolate synthase [Carnobacterium sp. ISL-102]
MFITYEEALNWIHATRTFGEKPGLKRMEWMSSQLDHPERKFKSIHIAGTNGKGSTLAFLRDMFEANGQIVGTYTSPYIEMFNERISVNGDPISDDEILRLANAVYPLTIELEKTILGGPSEFEIITMMMLIYFGEGHADIVLIEVGIGGSYDSTNIITPVVSIITTIGLDHMNLLGDTLSEIAANKAGVIKASVPVVIGKIEKEALKEIEEKATEQDSLLLKYNQDFFVTKWQTLPTWGEQFVFEDDFIRLSPIQIGMLGRHQVENAAVAIEALRVYSHETGLAVNHEKLLSGLKHTFWPGRMEKINDQPLLVLDGAHNEHAMKTLVETIKKNFAQQEVYIIMAAMRDKDIQGMVDQLQSITNSHLILTSFDYPRAARIEDLNKVMLENGTVTNYWQEALVESLNEMDKSGVLIVTGSLYFISEVREYFKTADK